MPSTTRLTINSSKPLYEQLMQHIRTAIVTGQYEEGSQLPPENELCELYGVSRITARRAVLELVNEGLLERRQGKGTFVLPKKMNVSVLSLDGFKGLRQSNDKASVRIIHRLEREATEREARMLRIPTGARIYELARAVDVDGISLSMDRSMYDAARFPGLLDLVDDTVSTYDVMTNVYHHPNHKASKEIVITAARPDEAVHLRCQTGELLYLISKTMYDDLDVPNHISFYLIRANMVKLSLEYSK